MITYRDIRPQDVSTVCELEEEIMNTLTGENGVDYWTEDALRNNEIALLSILEGKTGCAFLAEDSSLRNRKIIGAVLAIDDDSNSITEDHNRELLVFLNVFVQEEYRRKGIGKKLISMVEYWAYKQRYAKLHAAILLPNIAAQKLFETIGLNSYVDPKEKILQTDEEL